MDTGILLQRLKKVKAPSPSKRLLHSSATPLDVNKKAVCAQLKKEEAYRIQILRTVKTLACLSDDELRFAAHSMIEQHYFKGDYIIRQDEKGNEFYLLESGTVSVLRKVNMKDAEETPTELTRLHEDSFFGEISLMTEESRSASIVCHSDMCKCLIMTKRMFDEIRSQSHKASAEMRNGIARNVLNNVKFFDNMSNSKKEKLLACMKTVSYPAGAYITRQGSVGHNFFVLTDGQARITTNLPNGKEKDVLTLSAGSFFGEVSLFDPSSKRTANIIASGQEGATCLSLSRADFILLVKEEANQQAAAEESVHKETQVAKHADHIRPQRKVTGMNAGNKDDARMGTILARMSKFLVEGLWNSLYSRMYRDMVLLPDSLAQAGDIAWRILESLSPLDSAQVQRDKAVEQIRSEGIRILSLDPAERSMGEASFVFSLLKQRNKIRDELTRGWHPYQFTELCKRARFMRAGPLDSIIDVGAPLNSIFMVLRGTVRVWMGASRLDMRHQDDLAPGEVFCEASVLSGARVSQVFAQALTDVDLIYFDADGYNDIARKGNIELTTQEKAALLQSSPSFKSCHRRSVAQIATHLVQVEIPKGTILFTRGQEYPHLSLLVSGTISIVKRPGSSQVVAVLQPGEIFGESGFLTVQAHHHPSLSAAGAIARANAEKMVLGKMSQSAAQPGVAAKPSSSANLINVNANTKDTYTEAFCAIAQTNATALVFKSTHKMDFPLVLGIQTAFLSKNEWRHERLGDDMRKERRSMRRIARDTQLDGKQANSDYAIANSSSASSFATTTTISSSSSPMRRPATASAAGRSTSLSADDDDEDTSAHRRRTTFEASIFPTGILSGAGAAQAGGRLKLLDADEIEDIPLHLNLGLDPFLCAAVCINDAQEERVRLNMAEIRKPRSARTKYRSAKARQDRGFTSQIAHELGITSPRPSEIGLPRINNMTLTATGTDTNANTDTTNTIADIVENERVARVTEWSGPTSNLLLAAENINIGKRPTSGLAGSWVLKNL